MKKLINTILLAALSCAVIPAFGMDRNRIVAQLSKAHGSEAQLLAANKTTLSAEWTAKNKAKLAELEKRERQSKDVQKLFATIPAQGEALAAIRDEVQVRERARLEHETVRARELNASVQASSTSVTQTAARTINGLAQAMVDEAVQPVAASVSTPAPETVNASATQVVQDQTLDQLVAAAQPSMAARIARTISGSVFALSLAVTAYKIYATMNPTVYPTCYLLAGHSLGCW